MPLTVYIVEDEMINALSLKKELQRAGFQVCGLAAHHDAAVTGVTACRPDVVLMDINLGTGPDGIETIRRIREQMPVTVIFMTGYGDREIRERVAPLNPLACLDKPLDTALLVEMLEEVEGRLVQEAGSVSP